MTRKAFGRREIQQALENSRIDWTDHALDRLEERGISRSEVIALINTGEIIETYFDAYPLPKCLLLGYIKRIPLYLSIAFDKTKGRIRVVTCHWQDPDKWVSDRIRRKAA